MIIKTLLTRLYNKPDWNWKLCIWVPYTARVPKSSTLKLLLLPNETSSNSRLLTDNKSLFFIKKVIGSVLNELKATFKKRVEINQSNQLSNRINLSNQTKSFSRKI